MSDPILAETLAAEAIAEFVAKILTLLAHLPPDAKAAVLRGAAGALGMTAMTQAELLAWAQAFATAPRVPYVFPFMPPPPNLSWPFPGTRGVLDPTWTAMPGTTGCAVLPIGHAGPFAFASSGAAPASCDCECSS